MPVITVTLDDTLEDCCAVMDENLIRRVPVVDGNGCCCGMVAQADIAQYASPDTTGKIVRDISLSTPA